MKFLLGTKESMTQIFDEAGKVFPVTVVKTGPATVTQIKTVEKDGYDAIQVGYGTRREKNLTKAELGHMKGGTYRFLREYRTDKPVEGLSVGDAIDPTTFEVGDVVTTISISKGKGFQGVVKRYGFAGGRRSHGQKHSEREPGSIGATGPQRVFKGTRMGGRMGSDQITQKSVKVIAVDAKEGKIYLKGGVPGRRGSLVEIKG